MTTSTPMVNLTVAAFCTFTVSNGRKARIRMDLIGEVIDEQSSSVPFETTGTRLVLTTGREVSVNEKPDEVMDMLLRMWNIASGCCPED